MPIFNGMWAYRNEWENRISTVCSTAGGDASTAYRFDLCSHTGTYIETSQHKLNTNIALDSYSIDSFIQPCTLVSVAGKSSRDEISREDFIEASEKFSLPPRNALIVATGWGVNYKEKNFVSECPYFASSLTEHLISLRPSLIGFDVPVIDHPNEPYGAIAKLFEAIPGLLVIAPLVIDLENVPAGRHKLISFPLNIAGVCASLCRPILLEEK